MVPVAENVFLDGPLARRALPEALANADQLELECMRAGAGVAVPFENCIRDERITEETEDDTPESDHVARMDRETQRNEDRVANARRVCELRRRLLGASYPFELKSSALAYRGSRGGIYEVCVVCSSFDVRERANKQLQISFERLAGAAVAAVFRVPVTVVRSGYPSSATKTKANTLRAAIKTINASKYCPEEWKLRKRYRSPKSKDKDGGIDAVAWHAFDRRPGVVAALLNCACGRNWHATNKHLELPTDKCNQRLLSPRYRRGFLDAFCLSHHVVDSEIWDEATQKNHLVLDRIRLVLIVDGVCGQTASEHAVRLGLDSERCLREADGGGLRPSFVN